MAPIFKRPPNEEIQIGLTESGWPLQPPIKGICVMKKELTHRSRADTVLIKD